MRCLYCHNPDTWAVTGGREVTAEELLDEYDSVREFMHNGGITCTGGEPCLQIEFLTELFEKAKQRGINTCLDTCGITFTEHSRTAFDRLMKSTDLVMLDIKHIDPYEHKKLTGHSNENILAFADFISAQGVPLWIRQVIVPGWTDDPAEHFRPGEWISRLKTLCGLDVLPYHDFGRKKYEALHLPYPLADTAPVSPETAAAARDQIMRGLRAGLRTHSL